MSYTVTLYRRELAGKPAGFLEDPKGVTPFTSAERATLESRLARGGYEVATKGADGIRYAHFAYRDVRAWLTDRALHFSSGSDQESAYTILELGSELGMRPEFALFDPQYGRWSAGEADSTPHQSGNDDLLRRGEELHARAVAARDRLDASQRADSLIVAGLLFGVVLAPVLGYILLGAWGIALGFVAFIALFAARVLQVRARRARRK